MKIETVTAADIRKDLTLDCDGFNVNVDGRFNVYIKRENVGYVIDICVGDEVVDTITLWDADIDSIMEDENAD